MGQEARGQQPRPSLHKGKKTQERVEGTEDSKEAEEVSHKKRAHSHLTGLQRPQPHSPKPMGALCARVGLQLHCLEVPVLTHGLALGSILSS